MAPGRVLAFLESSAVARYACGSKNVRALPGTKIYYFRMDTSWESRHIMPIGYRATEYFSTPNVDKPIEQIWADQNNFSEESLSFKDLKKNNFVPLDLFMPLPPLYTDGKFVRGIIFSQCIDVFTEKLPGLKKYFHLCAYSMSSSYPKAETADAYFSCYNNPRRDQWFRQTFPDKASKILIPLEDSDFHNEFRVAPVQVNKDIDALVVARLDSVKNNVLVAKALKIYREKYEENIYLTHIVGNTGIDADLNGFSELELIELGKIKEVLIHPKEYIKLIPHVGYGDIADYYSRAKVLILASLLEGKNRSRIEAMSCNTPVICFEEFNQYIRGDDPAFPEGAGVYCDFDPESLADAIYYVIHNQDKFSPRYSYLKSGGGRIGFFNKIIDAIPYYKDNLPDYETGNHFNNVWIGVALQRVYGGNLHDFLYKGGAWCQGWDEITARLTKVINGCDNYVAQKNIFVDRRSRFEIAQAHFEAAEYELAYENYKIRSEESEGDEQEVFWSLYSMGRCKELTFADEETVLAAYLKAFEHTPKRIEPLYRLTMYYAENKKSYNKAFVFALACVNADKPEGALFLDDAVYDWTRFDDMGFICIKLGRFEQARHYIEKTIALNAFPPARKEGLYTNLSVCMDNLTAKKSGNTA